MKRTLAKPVWDAISNISWWGRLWEACKDIKSVLWPARFSIGMLLVAFPFLTFLPPSQDALLALVADRRSIWPPLVFAVVCLLWALQTFYWAQFMSRLPRRETAPRRDEDSRWLSPEKLENLNEKFPRVIGLLALIVVSGATVKANWGNSENILLIVGITFGVGALYCVLCWKRDAVLWLPGWKTWTMLSAMTNQVPLVGSAVSKLAVSSIQEFEWNNMFNGSRVHRDLFPLLEQAAETPQQNATDQGPQGTRRRYLRIAVVSGILITFGVHCFSGSFDDSTKQPIALALALFWLVAGCWYIASIDGGAIHRKTKRFALANFIIFTMIFICSLFSAEILAETGNVFTAPAVTLSVFAAWVFVGSFFIALPGERFGLPIFTIIVLFAVAWTFLFDDNHDVRLRQESVAGKQLALKNAVDTWHPHAQEMWKKNHGTSPVPLIIVATAGGASRAGYWTAKVLGELEDAHPDFHTYVFAISGVSGGSLGAAIWRAMIEEQKAPCPDGTFVNCARKFFLQDFLAPTFLTGLYADLAQRLMPGKLLPDRATALERSWEVAWRKVMTASAHDRFSGAFHELQPNGKGWRPLLILNGTSEKTGRRIITSHLAIDGKQFPDTIDFFGEVKSGVNLSTAVHNSARFTYIDAAGNIWLQTKGPRAKVDRIADGGYFENFGAATTFDLLQSLKELDPEHKKFLPVVIQISSDPSLRLDDARNSEWREKLSFWLDLASDTTAPAVTFYATRDALGYRATEAIERNLLPDPKAPQDVPRYFHFRLTDSRTPMSWAMSSFAIRTIDDEWEKTAVNREALADLSKRLWPSTPPIKISSQPPGCQ